MNKIISASLVLGAAWSLVGCGGGSSDPETVTKVIVDDPIVGLGYRCSSSDEMKKTNAKGEFTCNVGDSVTFYIGQYEIGSTNTSNGSADTMRIADLLDEDGDAAVTDIRQVLQTIDKDGTDGVIEIPDDFDDLDDLNATPGSAGFEEAVESELGEELIDGAAADKNADEAYQKYLLAGKTFYFVSHKYPHPTLMEVRFDETLSKASYFKDSVAVSENTLDLDGSQITQAGDAPIVFTAEEKLGYILVHAKKSGHPFDAKMYSKKSDAQAQYDEETAGDTDLKSLLAGKTFYFATPDGMTKAVFSADFTQVTTTDYGADGKADSPETDAVEVDGEKLITNESGDYIKFKSSFDDYLLFEIYSADNQKEGEARAYTDRAKAEAYVNSGN
jgi:YHS domain-containing protein